MNFVKLRLYNLFLKILRDLLRAEIKENNHYNILHLKIDSVLL